jgi:hypothetical protein
VWFDPGIVREVRKQPRFQSVFGAAEELQPDPELGDQGEDREPADWEDRRDIFEALAHCTPVREDGLATALADAVHEDGHLLHPLIPMVGELFFVFDDLKTLAATVSVAAPHVGTDPTVREAVDIAKRYLSLAGRARSGNVALGLATRVQSALEQARLVPAGYLGDQVREALVESRALRRRDVFGSTHAEALFVPAPNDGVPQKVGSRRPLASLLPASSGDLPGGFPAYLPDALATRLPTAERLRVGMLARLHPAIDPGQTPGLALQVLALVTFTPPILVETRKPREACAFA